MSPTEDYKVVDEYNYGLVRLLSTVIFLLFIFEI